MGLILLRPDDDLHGNVCFGPYLSHYWTDFVILPLATLALHTVSIWLRSTTNDFVYTTYRLLAYICVSILVIFFKIKFGAQTRISQLIYEWEEWEVVCEIELRLNEYYESDKKDMKYFTTWYLFKKPNNNVSTKSLYHVSEFSRHRTQSTLKYE